MIKFNSKTLHTLSAAALVSVCAACAAPQAATPSHDHAELKSADAYKTIKPGAALEFSHTIDGALSVGSYTDVTVQIAQDYDSGTLRLSASGSDDLDVLSSSASMTSELSIGQAPLNWRVAVRPNHDGVHYLNVIGEVTDAAGQSMSRVSAIRLDLGGKTVDASPGKPQVMMQNDKPVAVFQATETSD